MRRLLVEGLRWVCEADRAIDRALSAVRLRRKFHSTKGQDRWIVERALPRLRGGYFVEVGAADGRTHSNTYSLEQDYGWTGIVIEANPDYIPALRSNRACHCVHSCVDGEVREIEFFRFGHMGGIIAPEADNAREKRGALIEGNRDRIVRLQTSTLAQILETLSAPTMIDYLSIDVEGTEWRILTNFPFDRFGFRAVTVERPTSRIHGLLKEAGYVLDRIHRYDGFYVSRDRASALGIKERQFDGVEQKTF